MRFLMSRPTREQDELDVQLHDIYCILEELEELNPDYPVARDLWGRSRSIAEYLAKLLEEQ